MVAEGVTMMRGIWHFLRVHKRWWLAPILIFLVLLIILVILARGPSLAPFIYN